MRQDDTQKDQSFFMVTNLKMCQAIGYNYHIFFDQLFNDMRQLYQYYTNLITIDVQNNPHALNNFSTRKMRQSRKDIILFMSQFVSTNKDLTNFTNVYAEHLIEIAQLYQNEAENQREPEVIDLCAKVVSKIDKSIGNHLIARVLEYLLNSTLPMITIDFQSYPDHRINFFAFIKAIVDRFFDSLFNIPADQFKTIIDCVIWAFKHEQVTTSEIGLDSLLSIIKNVNDCDIAIINQFYQFYYIRILHDLLFVMTDGMHKATFGIQIQILQILIGILPDMSANLDSSGKEENNQQFVYDFILNLLGNGFPNLSAGHHAKFQQQIFTVAKSDKKSFKTCVRDYMISLSLYTQSELDINNSNSAQKTLETLNE